MQRLQGLGRGSGGMANPDTLDATGDVAYRGMSAEWNHSFGAGTLTYLGAHRRRGVAGSSHELGGFGPSHSFSGGEAEQTSHELRLGSAGSGALKWVAGLYAFDEDQATHSSFSNGVLTGFAPDFDSSSRALFGQGTWTLTPALRLTIGARTTRDEKSSHGQVSTFTLGGPGAVAMTDAERSWRKTDGKLGIDYEPRPGTMVYASLATGYKAGGFNAASAAGNSPVSDYDPEKLTALEAGWKTRLFGKAGQLNVSAFRYDYRDLQVNSIVGGGAGLVLVNNAATATVNGIEADLKLRAGGAGTVDASMAYTDARYDRFVNCVYEPASEVRDCSGNALRNAPRLTATFGYEHRIPAGTGTVTLRADTRFSARYHNDDVNSDLFRQGSYTRSGLSGRYDSGDYRYHVSLAVRNLENRNVMASRFPAVVGNSYGYMAAPRTVGITAGAQF